MNPRKNPVIDPMLEGHPDAFSEPRTIPTGWDLSGLITPPHIAQAEMNGTAYEQNTGSASNHDLSEDALR